MPDWNSKIIEEFRANGGKVGGPFEGAPLLLLHTVGARTGQQRVNPMMYRPVPGGYAVFASKGGAPTNPDWYHNLLAHPDVQAEIGTETRKFHARVAEGRSGTRSGRRTRPPTRASPSTRGTPPGRSRSLSSSRPASTRRVIPP